MDNERDRAPIANPDRAPMAAVASLAESAANIVTEVETRSSKKRTNTG